MKKHAALVFLILAVGFGSRLALGAQQADPKVRTRLQENISNLYLIQLTRALELTEEQAAKLYPLLTRAENDKAGIQRGMGQDLRDLKAELARTPLEEERVLSLVDRIREARRSIRKKDDEVEDVLDGILTPVQKARYYLFTVEFLRRIGENADRIRQMRGPIKRTS
jgi:Spy/CpxP family protein refolding chaperone